MKRLVCLLVAICLSANSHGVRMSADQRTVLEGMAWLEKFQINPVDNEFAEGVLGNEEVGLGKTASDFISGVMPGARQFFVNYAYNLVKELVKSGYETAKSLGQINAINYAAGKMYGAGKRVLSSAYNAAQFTREKMMGGVRGSRDVGYSFVKNPVSSLVNAAKYTGNKGYELASVAGNNIKGATQYTADKMHATAGFVSQGWHQGKAFTADQMLVLYKTMVNNPKMTGAVVTAGAIATLATAYGGWKLFNDWYGYPRFIAYDYIPSGEDMKEGEIKCKVELVYKGDKAELLDGKIPMDHTKLIPVPETLERCRQTFNGMPVVLRNKALTSIDDDQPYSIDDGTVLTHVNVVDDYLSGDAAERKERNNLRSDFPGQVTNLCGVINGNLQKVSVSDEQNLYHNINPGAFIETIDTCQILASDFKRENFDGGQYIYFDMSNIRVFDGDQASIENDREDTAKVLVTFNEMKGVDSCRVTTWSRAGGIESTEAEMGDSVSVEILPGISYISCQDLKGKTVSGSFFSGR